MGTNGVVCPTGATVGTWRTQFGRAHSKLNTYSIHARAPKMLRIIRPIKRSGKVGTHAFIEIVRDQCIFGGLAHAHLTCYKGPY